MKTYLSILLSLLLVPIALADIHDPPSNDYGPTRKLGRGLSNFFFAPAEVFVTVGKINKDEGNSTAASYGIVRGVGRSMTRHFVGLIEILSFPFPIQRDTYYPLLPDERRYIHAGYAEFPPELGNESKYNYVRDY
jgi:putative exosortase-associated protein (TIGR04073 family)